MGVEAAGRQTRQRRAVGAPDAPTRRKAAAADLHRAGRTSRQRSDVARLATAPGPRRVGGRRRRRRRRRRRAGA